MSLPTSKGSEPGVQSRPVNPHHSKHHSQSSTQKSRTMVNYTSLSSNKSSTKDENVVSHPDTTENSQPTYPDLSTSEPNNNVPLGTELHATTVLQPKLKQHAAALSFGVLAILLLGSSLWFIYVEFIREKPVPKHLQLSTGHTITVVNILSHLNVFLVALLLDSAYEALRWSLASRNQGVSIATFLSLSRATGFLGIADLLRVTGWHRFLCFQRFITNPIVLKSDISLF